MSSADDNKDVISLEQYGVILGDTVKYGALGLSLAMAQETGVVHVLCQADTPLTSLQVAQQAGLKERYVRELLGSLVAGHVVHLAPGTGTKDRPEGLYFVPQNHRKMLDKTSKTARYLSASARQFAAIKDVFPLDGPSCVRFNDAMLEMKDHIGPFKLERLIAIFLSVPGFRQKLESGIDVAELGSGTGWLICKLAAMFPKSRFTATGAVEGPLSKARDRAKAEGLTNITFSIVDAGNPPRDWNERFDWMLAFMTVHDLPHPQKALEGVRRALKPGGIFSMVDECVSSLLADNVGVADATFYYMVSTFNCIPESYQQADSEALGACWGEDRARQTVTAAGLKLLEVSKAEELGTAAVFSCQKPEK
ncbi:hypothetical protein BaRGS_00007117 [Batillaria attramentaria]|uniref:Methyltransferase domain-containing protein n=1 Tax=Batillaria attramentaria TaxID=370345 RepID=A0ABD0LQE7_9CAEN